MFDDAMLLRQIRLCEALAIISLTSNIHSRLGANRGVAIRIAQLLPQQLRLPLHLGIIGDVIDAGYDKRHDDGVQFVLDYLSAVQEIWVCVKGRGMVSSTGKLYKKRWNTLQRQRTE